jgi:SAM-dependent methyltransferase
MPGSDYDRYAGAYAADVDTNVFNALYERPSTLGLVGDVQGKRVLDAGCGSGAHSRDLLDRGASVVGFDRSAAMLAEARARLGDRVPLHQADLNEPLAFAETASFDVVVAGMVLHYLRDWAPPLREFARVLRPGGYLVLSTHHPFVDFVLSESDNYYRVEEWAEVWDKGGTKMEMHFWRRPLEAIFSLLSEAGFRLDRVSEGRVEPAAERRDPRAYHLLTTRPRFLFVRALRA